MSRVITRDGVEYPDPERGAGDAAGDQLVLQLRQVRLKVPSASTTAPTCARRSPCASKSAGVVERVLKHPAPVCLLKGFGDNAVELELRFWIHDPMNGVSNVKSDVLLHIWTASMPQDRLPLPAARPAHHDPGGGRVHKAADR
jgi:small-conductance mechanosensitive channel